MDDETEICPEFELTPLHQRENRYDMKFIPIASIESENELLIELIFT